MTKKNGKILDIYVCIDVDSQFEKDFLLKYIETYISSKKPEFGLRSIEIYKNDQPLEGNKDVILRGVTCLSHMFENLKLKHSSEVWFLYLTFGELSNKTVSLMLLNTLPAVRRCYYAIHNCNVADDKTMTVANLNKLLDNIDEQLPKGRLLKY